jgi:sugar phosphate isomerase/epimerase
MPSLLQDGVVPIGLMLYSVRDDCARDFEGTLRAVAALGYEGVELFDLHGHDPARVRGWLDELGLPVVGRHARLEALEERLPELAAEAATLGNRRLVVSWIEPPASPEAADAARDRVARAADAVAQHGLELGFHNHDAEVRPLADGRTFLDRLLELPVFLELDLGWIWYAGLDAAAFLRRHAGRAPLLHVKDFATRSDRSYRALGEGSVPYAAVLPYAADAEWLILEQDGVEPGDDPLAAAARSLDAFRALRDAE